MRKVKFPFDLDVIDLLSDDLKSKVQKVNTKYKEIEKERRDRSNVRKRTKKLKDEESGASTGGNAHTDPAKAAKGVTASSGGLDAPQPPAAGSSDAMVVDEVKEGLKDGKLGGEMDNERTTRIHEAEELLQLSDESLLRDKGSNHTALYELIGIITHKGVSAEGGERISSCR